jgi:hypothetical protein
VKPVLRYMIVCVVYAMVTLLMWMALSHVVVSYMMMLVTHINAQNVNDIKEQMISLVVSYMDVWMVDVMV